MLGVGVGWGVATQGRSNSNNNSEEAVFFSYWVFIIWLYWLLITYFLSFSALINDTNGAFQVYTNVSVGKFPPLVIHNCIWGYVQYKIRLGWQGKIPGLLNVSETWVRDLLTCLYLSKLKTLPDSDPAYQYFINLAYIWKVLSYSQY